VAGIIGKSLIYTAVLLEPIEEYDRDRGKTLKTYYLYAIWGRHTSVKGLQTADPYKRHNGIVRWCGEHGCRANLRIAAKKITKPKEL